MALTTTRADITNFLEVAYNPSTIKSLALKKAPLTAFFPKKMNGGLNLTTRLLLREAGGIGATLTAAIAEEADPASAQIIQVWKNHYTSFSLEDDAIIDSEKNSAISAVKLIVESTLRRHGDQLETLLWGTSQGYIGQIATGGISGDVVTLTNAEDCFKFEVGMTCVFDDAAAGTSLRTGNADVESIQYAAGTVTFDDLGDVTGEAVLDYIFPTSYEAGGHMGLQAWLPDTVASSGDAFGTGSFDRYPYGERASGWHYTATTGMSNREAIIKGIAFGSNFGGNFDIVYGSPTRVAALAVEMQNEVVYDGNALSDKKLSLSFPGMMLRTPAGTLPVVEAQKCPGDRWFVLSRNTWECHTVGELIRNPIQNGKFIDAEALDGIVGRWKTRYGLACLLPGHNGQVEMAD